MFFDTILAIDIWIKKIKKVICEKLGDQINNKGVNTAFHSVDNSSISNTAYGLMSIKTRENSMNLWE